MDVESRWRLTDGFDAFVPKEGSVVDELRAQKGLNCPNGPPASMDVQSCSRPSSSSWPLSLGHQAFRTADIMTRWSASPLNLGSDGTLSSCYWTQGVEGWW